MKNKIQYIVLFILLSFPILSFGQNISTSFIKGASSFILKITNKDVCNDIYIVNQSNIPLLGSELKINFLDKNGINIFSREWCVGEAVIFKIKKGETYTFEYSFSQVKTDFTLVKKVKVHLYLKYLFANTSNIYIYENDFVCNY